MVPSTSCQRLTNGTRLTVRSAEVARETYNAYKESIQRFHRVLLVPPWLRNRETPARLRKTGLLQQNLQCRQLSTDRIPCLQRI
jgi:hypothetical protein